MAVLQTAGDKFFSAGFDLKAAADGDAVDGDYGVGGFGGLQELPDLNKPVIAAVHGMAVGGGFEIALSCDLIYATAGVRFGLPEINAGTLADAATIKLPKRMPYHVAMELLLTGRWMEAEEAHRWGVVNEVLPDHDALMARVWEVARLLESGPPLVFAAIKETARAAEGAPFQEVLDLVTGRRLPDRRRALRLRGQHGGLPRLRREAPARVEGPLTLPGSGGLQQHAEAGSPRAGAVGRRRQLTSRARRHRCVAVDEQRGDVRGRSRSWPQPA